MDFYAEKRTIEDAKRALDGDYLRRSEGPKIVSFIERAYKTYYKDATNRPPDSYSHAAMRTALDLIADEVLVETPGALDLLSTFASEGYTWNSDDLENSLAFAISRVCESAKVITYKQREALWQASTRKSIFGWGRCVRFSVFSFPHDPDATIKLLEQTEFTDTAIAPITYLKWFLRFTDNERTSDAIDALFLNASATLISDTFDGLHDRELVKYGLPLMLPWVLKKPLWSQREFCQMCARLSLHVSVPALRWIALYGHRIALQASCEALKTLGSSDDLDVIKKVSREAWDPEITKMARAVMVELRTEQPHKPTQLSREIQELVDGIDEPTGWSFEERQLLDLCSRGCDTNASKNADAKLDDAKIAAFHELFADKVRRYRRAPESFEDSNLRQGIWVASEAPFDRDLHSARALIQLMDSPRVSDTMRGLALGSLFHISAHGQLWLDDDLARTVDRLARNKVWKGRKKLQLLTCALPYSLDTWLAALEEVEGFNDVPIEEHHHILQITDDDEAKKCLVSFYNLCDEMRLRGVLSETDMTSHARFFPIWIQLTSTVSASTRKVIAERLASTESLLVEPYFQAVVCDATEDQQVRVAAIDALGVFGGRLSIAALMEAQGARALRAPATRAIASIEERFPASEYASRGSLSIADSGDLSGALTQMGASEGDISIYQDVLDATRSKDTRSPDDSSTGTSPRHADGLVARSEQRVDIARLAAPPRSLPMVRVTYALVGTDFFETSGFLAMCIGLTLVLSVLGGDLSSMICPGLILLYGLLMCFASLTADESKADLELLRNGFIAPGKLLEKWTREEGSSDSKTTVHCYKFEFLAESGQTHTFTHNSNRALKRLTDEVHEPILYLLGDDGELLKRRPFDAMTLVRIDGSGNPKPSLNAWFFLLLDLICLAGCAWMLLQTYIT